MEMGGGVDLLEIALKIPPWEPMRMLSRDELRTHEGVDRRRLAGGQFRAGDEFGRAGERRARRGQRARLGDVTVEGRPALGRTHPLTVEGDEVGSFELKFACGEPGRDYIVT